MKFDIGDKVLWEGDVYEIGMRERDSLKGMIFYGLYVGDTYIAKVPEEEISPQYQTPKEGNRIKVRLGKTIFDGVIVEIEKSAYEAHPERIRYKVQLTLNKQLIWIDPSTIVQDSDKPDERQPKSRPDWIPADVILGMGDVLAWGKGKYPGNDWKTMSPDLHLAACQRHLLKHAKGELNDDESHMNHLYHAMVRLAFYTHLSSRSCATQNND